MKRQYSTGFARAHASKPEITPGRALGLSLALVIPVQVLV